MSTQNNHKHEYGKHGKLRRCGCGEIDPSTQNATQHIWYEAKMSNVHNQGLIIDEVTGKNIAITYEKEDARRIVLAVNSHDALVEFARAWVNFRNGDDSKDVKELWNMANNALSLAEGK